MPGEMLRGSVLRLFESVRKRKTCFCVSCRKWDLRLDLMIHSVRAMHFPKRGVLWLLMWVSFCGLCFAFPCIVKCSAFTGGVYGSILSKYGTNQSHRRASLADRIQACLNEDNSSEAQILLRSLLRMKQTDPDILLRVGVAFANKGLYVDAALVFERCVKEYPKIFESHYDLALVELAQRQYSEALSTVKETQAQNRREHIALSYMRGKIENAMGLAEEARKDLETAFLEDPREENYGLDLALFYLEHHDYPRAVTVFEKTRKYHPQSPFTGLGLALAQYLAGENRDCVKTCRQVLAQRPNFAPARTLLAFGLYMQGTLREAQRVAAEGLKSPSPHPFLNYIDVAISLKLQSKDYNRMLAEIKKAESEIPDCSLCYVAQSKVDEAQGDEKEAIEDLRVAIRLDSNFPEAWYRLGVLYGRAGQRKEAAQAMKRFEALKATKSQKETDMLRSVFIRAMTKDTQ